MLEIFRTNQFFATLLLIPYTFLIRIKSLINSEAYQVTSYDTPIAKYFFQDLVPGAGLQAFLACVIVFLTANFINRLIIQNRLSKHQTLIPGLFFILITAGMPSGLILSPALLSGFFIMLAILNLDRTYKNKESVVHIFNTGMYIGVASLIYPANIFLILFGFIGLLNLRSFKIKELLIYWSGIFVPFFLLGTYYYWNDKYFLMQEYFQFDIGIFAIFSGFSLSILISMISIGIIVVYIILSYNSYTLKNSIQVKKKIDIMYWFLLFSFLNLFFINGIDFNHFVILAIPFAVFIGMSFEKMKSKLMAEMIHITMLIMILIVQFQTFI